VTIPDTAIGPIPVTCPACGGSGLYAQPEELVPCAEWDCGGTGLVMGWVAIVDGEWIESTEAI
jgi:hypothetical protein